MEKREFAGKFENWIYDFDVNYAQIKNLCYEAIDYGFPSVQVFPSSIWVCKKVIREPGVRIAAMSSYPHGGMTIDMKEFEIKEIIKEGADDINCVLNIRMATDENWDYVKKELDVLRKAAGDKVLKVYLGTNMLNNDRMAKLAELSADAGADWVIDSVGKARYVGDDGIERPLLSSAEEVKILRSAVGDRAKIMVQNNVDTLELALQLLESGADRIATKNAAALCDSL